MKGPFRQELPGQYAGEHRGSSRQGMMVTPDAANEDRAQFGSGGVVAIRPSTSGTKHEDQSASGPVGWHNLGRKQAIHAELHMLLERLLLMAVTSTKKEVSRDVCFS